MHKRVPFGVCASLLFLCAVRLSAQSVFGTITGTVTDSTGAVVPGVTVTATHLATQMKASAKTNEAGVYTIANLREGDFRLQAQATGFQDITVEPVSVLVRGVRRVDLVLQVGAVQQTVEVTASAGLIETDTGKISDVRTSRELNSLARNAVSRSVEGYWPVTPMFNYSNGAPSFAGSRSDQWHASYDGASISNGMGGTTGGNIMDYSDWVKETKIDYANNSAEFGQVVQVALVSKSGENEFHGAAFEYFSSTGFNARDPFASSRSSGKTSIPGFSLGGPVYIPKLYNGKNRTFWFVSTEAVRAGGFGVTGYLNATVPLASWRDGQFNVPIRNPFTGDVYSDGKIPAQYINPVAKAIQDRFYPLPNYGDPNTLQSLNYRATLSPPFGPQYNSAIRLDQKLGDNDFIFGSFMLDQLRVANYEGNLPAFGKRQQLRQQKVINVTHSHTFRPTLLNEFRFGHGADTNKYQGPLNGPEVVNSLGLKGLAPNLPDIGGVYGLSFSGVGLTGLSQISYGLYGPRTQHFQDQVSYFRGRHAFKFGAQLSRVFPTEISAGGCLFGCDTFANTYTKVPGVTNSGNPYADFLFGVPTSASRNFPPLTVRRRRWQEDFYVTDDWKVTQRLTLNLGLRYELHPAWSEAGGMLAVFNPASGTIAVPDDSLSQVSALMPTSYVQVVKASSVGLPSTLIHSDTNNFAPRVGVAYRPFGNNTVLRGGYGIYYDATPAMTSMAGVPYSISEPTYTNSTPAPSLVLPQAFPATGSKGPATIGLPSAVNPNLRFPYTQQWNATVEHERWGFGFRVSYVGTTTRQMTYSRDINAPVVDSRPYTQKPRAFPNYPGISYLDNGASHTYNGATFGVQRRMKSGFQLEAAYTVAHDVGDAFSLENPYDRRRERGPELAIPRQRWTDSFMYELPFGRGRKWLAHTSRAVNTILGGWQVSAITYLQTGQFLTPTMSVPDPAGISYTTGSAPLVTIRPDVLRNPNISNRTLGHWFDTSAFVAPAAGRFGNSGRGLVVGPGENVWHAGLQKYITFSDSPRAPRLRLDLYAANVFNHPNWSNPSVNLSNANTAGAITSVGGPNTGSYGDSAGARTARMAIRVEW